MIERAAAATSLDHDGATAAAALSHDGATGPQQGYGRHLAARQRDHGGHGAGP
ncbi:hypothetical protein GCM10023259_024080 [Thermocatellispora tengchongensis]